MPIEFIDEKESTIEFIDTPDRDLVIQDFSSTEQDVVEGGAKTIGDARKGRVASYIASDGSTDFDSVFNNIEHFGKELTGKSGDLNETFQEISSQIEIGKTDDEVLNRLFEETEWIWGADGPMPADVIPEDMRIEMLETSDEFGKRSRGFEAFGRAIAPEWSHEFLGIPEPMPSFTKMDVAEDIVGTVAGTFASFKAFSAVINKAGGIHAIPGVNESLYGIAKVSPRLARDVERAMSMFAVIGTRSQVMSASTDIKERAKMLGGDALFSLIFPTGDRIAEIAKLGRASLPAAGAAVFALGTISGDTTEDKIIGGVTTLGIWAMSYGATYNQSKEMMTKVAKGLNIKDPKEFVDAIPRSQMMRVASKFRDIDFINRFVINTAKRSAAKQAAGQKLLPSEKYAVAKAQETAMISQAKAGEIPPIKADRAVLQSKAVVKGLLEAPAPQAPSAEQAPAIAEGQTALVEPTEPPVEVIREQNELRILRDAQMFEQAEMDTMRRMATLPTDEESAEIEYNENLLDLWQPPPNANDIDLTTPEGDSFARQTVEYTTRVAENVAGFFRRFGRQYVSDPVLAKKFEDSYHEVSAAPHKGILEVHDELQKYPRTARQDRTALTIALEADDDSLIESRLLPLYRQVKEMLKQAEDMQLRAGVITQTFEESHAERIEALDRQIAQSKGNKKSELIAEKRRLEEIKQYLPHGIVARRVMDEKLRNAPVNARKSFGKKLSQFHKHRKGTYSLKEYLEMGLIDENDLDVTKLLMQAYVDSYHKISVKSLMDWAKETGHIVPKGQDTFDGDEWVVEADMPSVARIGGIEGMKMSRLFAQGLEELSGANKMPYNAIDKLFGTIKVGQFIRPDIIYKHNFSQSVMGGSLAYNPVTLAKHSRDAIVSVQTKNDLWREFDKYGLYQKTDIPTRQTIDGMVQEYANKTKLYANNKAASKTINVLSGAMNFTPEESARLVKDKQFLKLAGDAFMSVPSMISNATWWGDEVQRTVSALNLIDRGYSAEKAAQQAARIHGAYSNVGVGYRNFMRRLLFVYSFRLLMPWQYQVKPWIDLSKYAHQKAKGKKANSKSARAAGWALMATTALPFLYDVYMKREGWEMDEQERDSKFRSFANKMSLEVPIGEDKTALLAPNWAPTWRYSKMIETPEGPKKITRVVGTPNVTFTRLGVRATKPMPENIKNEAVQGIIDATWGEMHPFYKMTWALIRNEPLQYGALPPRGLDGNDYVGGLWEYTKASVRLYGALAEMAKGDILKKGEADRLLDEHLNVMEKAFGWFGFDYISNTEDRKKIGKMFELKDNLRELGYIISASETLTEEEKKAAKDKIIEKTKKSFERIMNKPKN